MFTGKEGVLVGCKQVLLIPDGFETVSIGFTCHSAVSVNVWHQKSRKMELSTKDGENLGGD